MQRWFVKLLTGESHDVLGSPYFDASAGIIRFRDENGATISFYNIGALAYAERDLDTEDRGGEVDVDD